MKAITKYLSAIGRRGGASKSAAKRAAAQANGRKGGRPRKMNKQQVVDPQ
jgi:hypothetical protein